MKVVIIGSGNVASVLGRLTRSSGHQVLQVVSRSRHHAETLAAELDCPSSDFEGRVAENADLYLFAVKDSALQDMHRYFRLGHSLVVHTAGAVPCNVLNEVSVNHGVLYPLQSLRREMNNPLPIPLLVDGNSTESLSLITEFARSLSPDVNRAGDEERLKLHVAAVVVSNFTNHLYAMAEEFCKKEGIDFRMLLPLIAETTARISSVSPSEVQTGPAIRNDNATLEKHLRVLEAHPGLRTVYIKLTESIMH